MVFAHEFWALLAHWLIYWFQMQRVWILHPVQDPSIFDSWIVKIRWNCHRYRWVSGCGAKSLVGQFWIFSMWLSVKSGAITLLVVEHLQTCTFTLSVKTVCFSIFINVWFSKCVSSLFYFFIFSSTYQAPFRSSAKEKMYSFYLMDPLTSWRWDTLVVWVN